MGDKKYLMLMFRFNQSTSNIFQCIGWNSFHFLTSKNILDIILIKGLTDESNLFRGPHSKYFKRSDYYQTFALFKKFLWF